MPGGEAQPGQEEALLSEELTVQVDSPIVHAARLTIGESVDITPRDTQVLVADPTGPTTTS